MPTRAEVVQRLGEWLDFFSVHEQDGELWLTAKPSEWVPDEVFNPLLKRAMEMGGGYDGHHRAVRIPVEDAVPAPPRETGDAGFKRASELYQDPRGKQDAPRPIAPKKDPGFIPVSEIPRTPSGRVDIQAYAGLKEPEKAKPDNGYRFVGLDMLVSSPFQPRLEVNESFLEELVASVREKGVLVPLLVRRLASGNYEVVDGNTTLRAAKVLELKAVPVIIQELDDQAAMEVAYQRNNTRRDWSDYERARFLNEYGRRFGLNQEQIAVKTGSTQSRISQLFAMLKAEDIPEKVLSRLNEWQFRNLESLPVDKREEAIARIEKGEADITAVINESKPEPKFTVVKNEPKSEPSKQPIMPAGIIQSSTETLKGEREAEGSEKPPAGRPPAEPSAVTPPTPRQTTAPEEKQWWTSLEKIVPKTILDDIDDYVVNGGDTAKREFVPFYLDALYDAALGAGSGPRNILEEADLRQSNARDEEAAPQ